MSAAYDELKRRKIDVWHFLEEVYGHDEARHPFGDDERALDWYAEHEEPKGFFKKVAKYHQEWME